MKTSPLSKLIRAGQNALATEKGRQRGRLCCFLLLMSLLLWVLSKSAPTLVAPDFVRLNLKIFALGGAATALLIAFPRLGAALRDFKNKLVQQAETLATPQRLYLRVVQLALVLLFLAWLNPGPTLAVLGAALGVFCLFVALYDASRLYKAVAESTIGKAVLAVGLAAASALAYALARQEIAAVTHVVPTNFQHTTILVSILTIPFLVVFAGGALFAVCVLASGIVIPMQLLARDMRPGILNWLFAGALKENPMRFPLVTRLFQFFFYAVLGTMVSQLGKPLMQKYEAELQRFAPAAIYSLDMYEGRECPLAPGEKLAALGDSKFLVGRRDLAGKIEFVGPIKCDDLPIRAPIP